MANAFSNTQIDILFSVMNPGVNNGTFNPYEPVDFFRADVYSYAGGEGIATLWGYACTGGFWLTSGLGVERQIVFVPLTDNVWENILISYNFVTDFFSVTLNGTEIYSNSLTGVFSPLYTIEDPSASFTIFSGCQYAIDELQRRMIPVALSLTYTLRSNDTEMTYASTYQADFPGALAIDDTFDTTQAPLSASFISNKEVVLSGSGNSIIGTATMGTSPTDIFYWEVLVGDSIPMFSTPYVGTFIQAYGPPFDPETAYGGPLSCYYTADGEIAGYGMNVTGNDTFTSGDVIGVVCNTVLTRVYFYKNGVQQATYANMSNNIAQHMCGFGFPPA